MRNAGSSARRPSKQIPLLFDESDEPVIGASYDPRNNATVSHGDCLELLRTIPNGAADLVVTSPPYNIGKKYERKTKLDRYLQQQSEVIRECARVVRPDGHTCWQVGNYAEREAIRAFWPVTRW
jgi:DNA modification methylase